MGTWLTDALCLQHDVAIYDPDIEQLKFVFNTQRLTEKEQIQTTGTSVIEGYFKKKGKDYLLFYSVE